MMTMIIIIIIIMKKRSEETQTLELEMRWSLPSPTNPVW